MGRARFGRNVADKTRSSLEDEIHKFAADDYLWHRHITGVELRPHQQVYISHLKRFATCLMIASRRLGKSFSVASFLLKEAITKPRSEVNIHAPALEQSKRNLRYMIDMVLNSPILMNYVEKKLGEGIGKESIEFINGSVIQAKGQASSVDGLGATHQWWEEADDMDLEVLFERIYPTGSMLKPGYDYSQWGQCSRIATGTIKGMGNIYNFENPRGTASAIGFHVLPKYTGWHGVHWGVIPRNDLLIARDVLMTPEMFARAYLCLYTESANFFPTRVIDACQDPTFEIVDIAELKRKSDKTVYQQQGLVTVGIDCGGQGSSEHASEWSINFVEDLGWGRIKWLYARRFTATENPETVRQLMASLIDFFRPGRGYGDAFDTTFLYGLNRLCFERKITRINPDNFENRAGRDGWSEWFIVPIRFIGMHKHEFYKNLRLTFYQKRIVIPYLVRNDERFKELEKLRDQLENIKRDDKSSAQGYDTYSLIRAAIGDDHVDSLALAVYAQHELTKTVKPLGIGVESAGFREFSTSRITDNQNFTNIGKDMFNVAGPGKRPQSVQEFLDD